LNLDRTAVQIAKDLKKVVFVGAYAAIQHGVTRTTRDIDIALATPKTDEELEELGYQVYLERGRKIVRTKNGIKIDIYTKDISGIPVQEIFATALTVKKAGTPIRIICLEALLLAKMRAARPQDNEDLRRLCMLQGKNIRWNLVGSMARDLEVIRLRQYVTALS
jgi:predicted nucleotidyltransferase